MRKIDNSAWAGRVACLLPVPEKRVTADGARPLTAVKHLVADDRDGPERSRRAHYDLDPNPCVPVKQLRAFAYDVSRSATKASP